MGKESIVYVNIAILSSVHDKLMLIKSQIRAPNLSLTIQRLVSDFPLDESLRVR